MDDTFIHSTAEEHMDDLLEVLQKGATKIRFENITTQMPILQEKGSICGIRISG